jgi:hypothetical protein
MVGSLPLSGELAIVNASYSSSLNTPQMCPTQIPFYPAWLGFRVVFLFERSGGIGDFLGEADHQP